MSRRDKQQEEWLREQSRILHGIPKPPPASPAPADSFIDRLSALGEFALGFHITDITKKPKE